MANNRFVLCVGLVCIDEFCVCEQFPQEDTGVTCLSMYRQRGGNASNDSTVLSLLGAASEFLGTMAGSHEQITFLKENFQHYGIHYGHCPYIDGSHCPISTCILGKQKGSRTVIHYNKNLPELTHNQFMTTDLRKYKWIHFEGRPNVTEMKNMLQNIKIYNQTAGEHRILTSIELEKKRSDFGPLLNLVDYVFVSKEFCRYHGYSNKEDAVEGFAKDFSLRSNIICAWSETGAIARTKDGETFHTPIYPPEEVVDTCGAGDTFIAATIYGLGCKGFTLERAIHFGSLIAGAKCGMQGFDGLKDFYDQLKVSSCV